MSDPLDTTSASGARHDADLDLLRDGLIRVCDAAEFLGLARSTLYQLMERGELPYAKIGRARRIPRRAVVALAARSLVGRASGSAMPFECSPEPGLAGFGRGSSGGLS